MKVEIKLDPQDIEEIARRLASEISGSLMEMESRIRKSQPPAEKPPAEKVWKIHDREWWNDKQVAEVIGIAVATLRNWRSARNGPTYQKIGKRVLYSRSDVLEFMNSFPKTRRRE